MRVIVRWTVRSNQVDLIMRWKLIFAVLCTNVGVDLAKNLFALLLVVEKHVSINVINIYIYMFRI